MSDDVSLLIDHIRSTKQLKQVIVPMEAIEPTTLRCDDYVDERIVDAVSTCIDTAKTIAVHVYGETVDHSQYMHVRKRLGELKRDRKIEYSSRGKRWGITGRDKK